MMDTAGIFIVIVNRGLDNKRPGVLPCPDPRPEVDGYAACGRYTPRGCPMASDLQSRVADHQRFTLVIRHSSLDLA